MLSKKKRTMSNKPRRTVGTTRVAGASPKELRLEENPDQLIDTRGWVGGFDSSVRVAGLLLEAFEKGTKAFWTGHFENKNGAGHHCTVIIPRSYTKPEWTPADDKQALYIGSARIEKLIPRRKPIGESVGMQLTPTQCLELAGLLLLGAARLATEGRKYVAVTTFVTHENTQGFYTTVTLE
jgi:hypothetical protein